MELFERFGVEGWILELASGVGGIDSRQVEEVIENIVFLRQLGVNIGWWPLFGNIVGILFRWGVGTELGIVFIGHVGAEGWMLEQVGGIEGGWRRRCEADVGRLEEGWYRRCRLDVGWGRGMELFERTVEVWCWSNAWVNGMNSCWNELV
jgi:hypothetical protein